MSSRIVFLRAPAQRLTPEQIASALGSMADDDPRWLAVHQLLDEELGAAIFDVTAPNAENRDHAAGRGEALATLKQKLLEHRQKPVPEPSARRK